MAKMLGVALCLICLVSAASTQAPRFRISYRRSLLVLNSVTLSCSNSVGRPAANAHFFRNKVLFLLGNRNEDGSSIIFSATRTIEGNFSCGETGEDGTVVMSPAILVIALPDNTLPISVDTAYARVNSQARINCSIPPSPTFLNRYGVMWINSSNSGETFYSQLPLSGQFRRKSSRYELDPQTFSLLISKVQPLDGISDYMCILNVLDEESVRRTFSATTQLNLSLVVFVPPAFNLLPTSVVTAQGRESNASFQCEVRSAPQASRIVWYFKHGNNDEVQIRESEQYHVVNSTISEGGTTLTHGRMAALDVNGFSNGQVRCESQYVVNQFGKEVILERRSATATLTVLSRPINLEALPTEDGGFIFKVTLDDALPVPVAVQLRFRDTETNRTTKGTQSDVFMNTRTITTYRETLPYKTFQVRVGVVYNDVRSQFYGDNVIYAVSDCEKSALIYRVLSICEGVAIFLLLLVLFSMVFIHALEDCLKQDEGHKAAKMLANVNCKRLANVNCKRRWSCLLLLLSHRRKNRGLTNSQEVELIPQNTSSRVEVDGESEEPRVSDLGMTDKLAKKYVDALKLAVKFGLGDLKIKKELMIHREHFNIDSDTD